MEWDPDNVISTEKTTGNNQFDPLFKIILDIINRSNHLNMQHAKKYSQ
jgi:hypothetical protein